MGFYSAEISEFFISFTRFASSNPVLRKISRIIEIGAAVIPLLFIVFILVPQFFHPGYNAFQDEISFLVWGPYGWILTAGFYLLAFSLVVLVIKLSIRARKLPRFRIGVLFVALILIGVVLVGAHPTDPQGTAVTSTGLIHLCTIAVVIFMFPIACFIIAPETYPFFSKKWLPLYTRIAGILALVFIAATAVLVECNLGWVGTTERLIVFNSLAWMQVVSVLSL